MLFISRAAVDFSDADLAQHFKLNITDNGDGKEIPMNSTDVKFARKWLNRSRHIFFFLPVGFAEESSAWGHPPDPKVQSKSFKRLQKHLQEHEDDGKLIRLVVPALDFGICFLPQ